MLTQVSQVVLRGAALFLGLFSAANAVVWAVGVGRGEDLWWIDLSAVPSSLAALLTGGGAVALVTFALSPELSPGRRVLTVALCLALAAAAASNVVGFYSGWRTGSFVPAVPVPFSVIVGVVLLAIAASAWWMSPESAMVPLRPVVVVAVVFACAFPLLHVAFFGTTDYRAPADAAVVLGARVHPGGMLSQSLDDRVITGVELYRQGLVPLLVMSGGTGAEGIDEAAAMKSRAVMLGVPADAILTDSQGVDTDSTVSNTTALLGGRGAKRVLVVSQFYHLPRIKMAYRAAGWQVRTVPALVRRPIAKTPLFVMREIPGFWVYWARAAWRDMARGGRRA